MGYLLIDKVTAAFGLVAAQMLPRLPGQGHNISQVPSARMPSLWSQPVEPLPQCMQPKHMLLALIQSTSAYLTLDGLMRAFYGTFLT